MKADRRHFLITELRSSVERLAKPAREQTAWIEESGVHPDELALLFDDAVRPAADNLGEELASDLLLRLELLNDQLSSMSGSANSELWTADAILNHPKWIRVRALANAALQEQGWPTASQARRPTRRCS